MSDPDLRRLCQLLAHASSRTNRPPRIVLLTEQGARLAIYISSVGAANPGTVTVVAHASKQFERFGFVLPNGDWQPDSRRRSAEGAVLPAIRRFLADPAAAASDQGSRTGICSFCGLDNANRHPFFHPQCAEDFGIATSERIEGRLDDELFDYVSDEPERCPDCGEALDPELEYCWECQCSGKDWD